MIVGYKKRGDERAGKGFYDGSGIKGGNDIIPVANYRESTS
jgi:hypothetical protein